MNKQLKDMKQKFSKDKNRAEDKSALSDRPESESKSSHDSGIDAEREEVLSAGRSFVRPLTVSPQKTLKITAYIVLALLITTFLVFTVLIYRFQSDSDAVYRASQIIPFPAARVDGSFIRYDEYLFELQALKQYAQNPIGGGEDIDFDSEEGQEQLSELQILSLAQARDKLIVRQIADERGVDVSDDRLEELISEFADEMGGEDQLKDALEEHYDWRMRDFESEVAMQLLQEAIVRDKAESVLSEVEAGEKSFADLAVEYSRDGSAADGGDLGFIKEGSEFVEEFEVAALNLEEGEISDIVETQFGFHILKATEVDEDEGVRTSHILIDPSYLQEIVDERLDDVEQTSYIGVSFNRDEPDIDAVEVDVD